MSIVTIDRLGYRGDGIAPGPIYIPRALPGEKVEGKVTDGRMTAPVILSPSPRRVTPPCPHYAECGGCSLMHAEDAFVAAWKVGIVRQALAARSLPAPITGIATSPPASRRRAVLTGRRTGDSVVVGFHAARSDRIAAIPLCRVVTPAIADALPILEEIVRATTGRDGEVSLTVTDGPAGLDVAVTGSGHLSGQDMSDLAVLAESADLARLTCDGETVALRRPPFQTFGPARVVPPPGAFLQATRHGEAALLASVRHALGDAARIADLFAGCGTFALPLAAKAQVHAVEGAADLTAALLGGWRTAPGMRPLMAETRDLFRRPLLAAELAGFDAVSIDPPRAGAEAQMRQIAASPIKTVASVSCDPVTFARDARILCDAGFVLDWVRVVDQFRWSSHVEIVARLTRQG
ncbi:23S rRNA (Uracil-5-)-methyltransferase rumA [Oceaniovalibus guishaninsula JLT2003]|uniref:23S rRNA (Uracil-5-)-methyltransferase rumA n=1 Tax=Oceaniovalibus guishaninsula JLT2003 TaxID=1231392 RepID=K2I6Q3_9RHOB|nr:class I SAM-dependent RNA methyltransferase [Oceaniovalibus guishaninsula]EKE44640.1 23S rRNA (Uracil-5-)-methyltransferase rumA [Oceaniovalibus guishaninsula JLT2003]